MAVKYFIIKIHLDGKSQNANDTNWFAVRFQCIWDIKTIENKMKLFESNGGFMEPSLCRIYLHNFRIWIWFRDKDDCFLGHWTRNFGI